MSYAVWRSAEIWRGESRWGTTRATWGDVDLAGAYPYDDEGVAAQQVPAQRQADTEAAERLASAALGQYIAPTNAPARTPHR